MCCTSHYREKDALREAYMLLNEAADKLYGPEGRNGPMKATGEQEEENDEDDFEALVAKERAELQLQTQKSSSERRFQKVDTGTQNLFFVKTTLQEDPVRKILSKLNGNILICSRKGNWRT